jgi:hypothetical protein
MKQERPDFKAILEEVLQIQMSNSEFDNAQTLESLAERAAEQLGKTPNAIGPDVVRAFLDLRSAIASVVRLPMRDLLPSTSWQTVLPETNPGRRRAWKQIQKVAHVSLPGLGWPSWPWVMADIVSWTLAPFAYFALGEGLEGILAAIALLAVAIMVSAATARAAGTELPHKTLAESARHAATERWEPSASGTAPWTPADVLSVLRELEVNLVATRTSA